MGKWKKNLLFACVAIGLLLFGGRGAGGQTFKETPNSSTRTHDPAEAAAGERVYFGGFAFAGNAGDVEKNFPISSSINQKTEDGTPYLGKVARDFFQANKDRFTRMNLQFGLARKEDTSLVLALAITDETVLREQFSDFHKVVIWLGFELLILDFKSQEVVSSLPVFIELNDVSPNPFTDAEVGERMKSMISGAGNLLFPELLSKADKIQPLTKNQSTLQVRQVTIGEQALPFLPEPLRRATNAYAQTVAQQFGSLLSSRAGVVLLPYAKDGLNTKVALVFSDASAVQFKVPTATFAVDVDLQKFKKVLNKETDVGSVWIYGAFLGIRVYEPEFSSIYFDAPVKYGVSKIVPPTQKAVDEFPVLSEALKNAFLTAIEQIQKDKKANEKVLKKCAI